MKTSDFFKKLLELTNLSKGELAAKIGKPQSRVSEWLGGTYTLKFDDAMQFCEKLKIDPKDLF